jgi:ABC-type polysaccharide/polyol phosphate transport system ATPase subunit
MGAVRAVLVMNIIELNQVSIDYQLDSEDAYNFKNAFINFYSRIKQPQRRFFRALNNVSFAIKKGEKVGIIGLNGAGKSTLLRTLSGIFQPTEGNIHIRGHVSPLLDFATGFEEYLTGYENIKVRLMFLGLSKKQAEQKIPEIIEYSGLHEFIHQPVRSYSSGMYIRLAFATSTSIDPEILIADEIIGTGDAQFAEKAKQRLESFLSRDCTMILSSHSKELIYKFCKRVIWLHHGKVMEDGDVESVFAKYEEANAATTA